MGFAELRTKPVKGEKLTNHERLTTKSRKIVVCGILDDCTGVRKSAVAVNGSFGS